MDIFEQDFSIIYVIDPPGLLIDSIFLLCSIRKMLGNIEVIAYCPEHKSHMIPKKVADFYDAMGAEIRFMSSVDAFDPYYKQGNKIVACQQPRNKSYTLFLDTDTVIARPFTLNEIAKSGCVSVVPEGVMTWGRNMEDWNAVYAKFGLSPPEDRVLLAKSKRSSAPYFNAGVLLFPNAPVENGARFADIWYETAATIDADDNVPNRRPWLDQISLPVAIARAGLSYHLLDDRYNYSLTRKLEKERANPPDLKMVDRINASDPKIIHHHQLMFFANTKFEAIPDDLVSEHTVFSSAAELTRPFSEYYKLRGRVWKRFGILKEKDERTEEENAEFAYLRSEKAHLNNVQTVLDLYDEWPSSIVKRVLHRQASN